MQIELTALHPFNVMCHSWCLGWGGDCKGVKFDCNQTTTALYLKEVEQGHYIPVLELSGSDTVLCFFPLCSLSGVAGEVGQGRGPPLPRCPVRDSRAYNSSSSSVFIFFFSSPTQPCKPVNS